MFDLAENAEILLRTLFHYRDIGAYLLHEFVIMPDHIHLLLTPCATTSLEKAIQLMKGGSSHRIHKQREHGMEIWQRGFYDWTVRDASDWHTKVEYIQMNPVRAKLAAAPEDWPYSSTNGRFTMDLRPDKYQERSSGAKAPIIPAQAAGLKPRPPEEVSSVKAPIGGAQTVGLKPRPREENVHGSMAAGASSRFPDENARDRAIVERAGGSDVHRENCK